MSNHLLLESVLPVDLGFGFDKAKYKGKTYLQPAVIGEPRRVFDQDIRAKDYRTGILSVNPKTQESEFIPKYFVGDLAVRQSNNRYYSIGDNKANTWTTGVQLETILSYLSPNQEVFLVTGLPLDFYFDQLNYMDAFLTDFAKTHPTKDFSYFEGKQLYTNFKYKVIGHHIVPQPMGACMNYLLDDRGQFVDKMEASQIIVVGDVGFHTFDILIYDGGEIHRLSHSNTDISISNAYRMVQEWLRPQVVSVPDIYTLDAAMLKGEYQGIDLSDMLTKMCELLASQIRFELDSLNLRYHKYIGTGGWSSLITPMLNLPEQKVIIYGQEGNMDGYGKIGARKCLM